MTAPKEGVPFREMLTSGRFYYGAEIVTTRGVPAPDSPSHLPEMGRQFFRELAAKQLAVFKGLGFAAGYLGGITKAETFGEIIDLAEGYGESEELLDRPVVIYNPQLKRTSAWANTYLDRDHFAPDNRGETPGRQDEAKGTRPNGT